MGFLVGMVVLKSGEDFLVLERQAGGFLDEGTGDGGRVGGLLGFMLEVIFPHLLNVVFQPVPF